MGFYANTMLPVFADGTAMTVLQRNITFSDIVWRSGEATGHIFELQVSKSRSIHSVRAIVCLFAYLALLFRILGLS